MTTILVLAGCCLASLTAIGGVLFFGMPVGTALAIWLLSGPAMLLLGIGATVLPRQRRSADGDPRHGVV